MTWGGPDGAKVPGPESSRGHPQDPETAVQAALATRNERNASERPDPGLRSSAPARRRPGGDQGAGAGSTHHAPLEILGTDHRFCLLLMGGRTNDPEAGDRQKVLAVTKGELQPFKNTKTPSQRLPGRDRHVARQREPSPGTAARTRGQRRGLALGVNAAIHASSPDGGGQSRGDQCPVEGPEWRLFLWWQWGTALKESPHTATPLAVSVRPSPLGDGI